MLFKSSPLGILNYFQVKDRPFSFTSAQEMRARVELLPSPPRWKQEVIEVDGGDASKPLTLYYRNGLACFRFLFGNPLFFNHMDYCPRREFTSETRADRLYNEIMTGERAWDLQVRVL